MNISKHRISLFLQFLEIALSSRTEVVIAFDHLNRAKNTGEESDDEEQRMRDSLRGPSKEAIAKFAQHSELACPSSVLRAQGQHQIWSQETKSVEPQLSMICNYD